MSVAPRKQPEAFVCQDPEHLHSQVVSCTRRTFLGGAAVLGAGAWVAGQPTNAQPGANELFRIDVHHHLSSPGFIAEITGRRTGQVPLMKWTVTQSIEDMDKGWGGDFDIVD